MDELGAGFHRQGPAFRPQRVHPAADAVARFQHHDGEPAQAQLARCGKACDPGADDYDVHAKGMPEGAAAWNLEAGRTSRAKLSGRFARSRTIFA